MKLKLRCREQEIRIQHMESAMPGLSKRADELSRPEATPEENGRIHNGMSISLSDETKSNDQNEEEDDIVGYEGDILS